MVRARGSDNVDEREGEQQAPRFPKTFDGYAGERGRLHHIRERVDESRRDYGNFTYARNIKPSL